MQEELKKRDRKYLYLIVGYSGITLIGITVLRYLATVYDTFGQGLFMFGYLLLVSYFKFADDRIGATTIDKIAFRTGTVATMVVIVVMGGIDKQNVIDLDSKLTVYEQIDGEYEEINEIDDEATILWIKDLLRSEK
ncbi:hypothetical protein SAMN05216389_12231 [Oceanobacillus limi]|uniref:Uncharacterized protein n=1 Tax=Oceanobacillus limi TaxID=930131 RepID=A0A1I0GLB6_9BACI|nr:hypothetical protein [Oceanobacillus limi]SET71165.1 hypothetical protein SAMN05216389_12231 [Oceanobacillus limi]